MTTSAADDLAGYPFRITIPWHQTQVRPENFQAKGGFSRVPSGPGNDVQWGFMLQEDLDNLKRAEGVT